MSDDLPTIKMQETTLIEIEGRLWLTADQVMRIVRERYPAIPGNASWNFAMQDWDAAFNGLEVKWTNQIEVDSD